MKSNIGHLKAAAGAAGMLKAVLALHEKVLPPSINFDRPNPNLDWTRSPFAVNTELRHWEVPAGQVRVAGVSAFGFGGTNFHVVMEEHLPGRLNGSRASIAVPSAAPPPSPPRTPSERGAIERPSATSPARAKPSLRGALLLGADDEAALANELRTALAEARLGRHLDPAAPSAAALRAPERLAIDYVDGEDLVAKAEIALRMFQADTPAGWPALRTRGIYRGSGAAGKVAFLYTGQGSQYPNMLGELRRRERGVCEVFDEADAIMAPLLEGRRLSDIVFVDPADEGALARAEDDLRRTEITQPAVLTVDAALTRLLGEYGIAPDLVMGHSLGEYAALVAADALSFEAALQAVSARGREMASLELEDPGAMAAVSAPLEEIEAVITATDGYVVPANINSTHQLVLGGETEAVGRVVAALQERGHQALLLPVSHAFHTEIVAPVSAPLRATLQRLGLRAPKLPIVANVDGELYPSGDGVEERMLDILARQVASPVQFLKGLHTLYEEGVRVFVEVGPKRALQGFASDVLGDDAVVSLATNHPKQGDIASFNSALCGLWAAGLGVGLDEEAARGAVLRGGATAQPRTTAPTGAQPRRGTPAGARLQGGSGVDEATYNELGRLFAEFLERGRELIGGRDGEARSTAEPVVITGASIGLPGTERLFDEANVARMLDGEQGIDVIPARLRREILDKHITRLVKDEGGASFEKIDSLDDVIKLAARAGAFDPQEEFGIDADRLPALGRDTQLAIAAGIDALRDAGIPLVLGYKTTTTGTRLPDRWSLPEQMRDDTGVIFASAFPGLEEMADEATRAAVYHMRGERLSALESLRDRMLDHDGTDAVVLAEVEHRIHDVRHQLEEEPYSFDRRFIFRVLSMGHSQLAEMIGARGPNTQINSACASTTQAVALAEDWIRVGRCRRVLIVAADDATSDTMLGWLGSGFLASGAAATDEVVEEAALPFDRRRHGMILGMGAAGIVVESAESARARGLTPICEVLGSVTANSAFHGTRLDVEHIGSVMEQLVAQAEARGVRRREIAPEMMFVSHETYTPARGGSAAAEIHALRSVFGDDADRIVIANVKGFTGHPMGVGLEDVVAVKALETGVVPPVPNFRDPDPELGTLNLSRGGVYPVRYALRLAAGFGSQISLLLLRWTPVADGLHRSADDLGYAYRVADPEAWTAWLRRVSGYEEPVLEVVQHRLRVVDQGPPAGETVELERGAASAGAPVERSATAAQTQPPVSEPAAVPAAAEPTPAVAAPAQAPAGAAEEAAAAGAAVDGVEDRVLEILAQETGYPQDLLDMDLDLEADLGIDTVKQAEVFATIREGYGIQRDDSLKLRDYPTINHVVAFVRDRTGLPTPTPQTQTAPAVAAPAQAPAGAAKEAAAAGAAVDGVEDRVLEILAQETGYPQDLLDMDLDLEADLGIDTVKQAEVFATIREGYGIQRDDSLKLRDYPTINHVVAFVRDRTGLPTPTPQTQTAPAVAAPAQAPAGAAKEAAAAGAAVDGVEDRVLEILAQETGYPQDLLDMDLDLEADLGIDTVKQAEVFATIREGYGIQRDDSLKLRDYPTINHVVAFVRDRTGLPTPTPQTQTAPAVAPKAAPAAAAPTAQAPAIESGYGPLAEEPQGERFPRRVPVPVLRPPLECCVGSGVALGEGSRVVLMPDGGGVGAALAQRLGKLGVEVLTIDGAPQEKDLETRIGSWAAGGRIDGVYWLPALDAERPAAELDPAERREALRLRVKLLAVTMRALADHVGPSGTFLVSATRLGGRHGYDREGATSVLGGAVTGFTKALARERPAALVKAVDFEPSRKTAGLAELLLRETLCDPGVVEVGYADELRWSVGLIARAAGHDPGREPGHDTVFLVTGAAGSIVSAITADLAAASGGSFHLLDLVPAPDRSDPDLARFEADRDGLKAELPERIRERGERPTPKLVERELARIERARAALDAIEAIERAGGAADWHQVDLTDAGQVTAAVEAARAQDGHVDVVLHCAGLEISHFLPDKPQPEYDLVFDVKAEGWLNVLHAFGEEPPGNAIVFSSIAGRFGNGGQTDYAAANDLLCKSVSNMRRLGDRTRGVAIDWTAWSGIGMASRGSIPKMMHVAGIDMLAPEVGIPIVRRELAAAGAGGEVLVAGALGVLLEERHPSGGVDAEGATEALAGRVGPMTGRIVEFSVGGGLRVLIELDPGEQAFLHDHRIEGIPVLPGVMGMEGFAEAARLLLPDWHVVALEGVQLLVPFKFYRDEPRTLEVRAVVRDGGDGTLVADCELIGRRALHGKGEQEARHVTGRVRLARELPPAPPAQAPPTDDGEGGVGRQDVYRAYFHGPAYQVLDRVWRENGGVVGRLAAELPADHEPASQPTEFVPRLIELCFQTAGIWELGTAGRMALPTSVERVARFAGAEEPGRLWAVVRPRAGDDGVDADVVDETGRVRVRLEGYRTIELPGGVDENALSPIRLAMGSG